ncbi:MAG: caspase family protein [Proteobacteria bacterium]|nr:caspase family protein [Pseudomonadota bacterium]
MRRKIVLSVGVFIFFASFALAEKGSLKIGAFPAPPQLSASVKFVEPSGNNILDAGETGKLIVTVQNTGKGDAFDVKGQLKTNKQIAGLSFNREVAIGTILSGKTAFVEIPVQASEDIPTDSVTFDIEVKEANGFDAAPLKLSFKTKAFEPPKLVVADIGINDQNKNSRVEPMEIVELIARIQNMGYGDARGVSVDIQPGQNVFIAGDGKTRFDLGSIQAGKFKDVTFMFYTNNRIKDGEKIPLSIQVNEARPRFSTLLPLTLVMNAPQKSVEEIVVKGEDTEKKPDITLAGGLSVDVDMHIPEGEKAGKFDIAVIIGNKNYKNIPNVEYADRDAVIMKEYLIRAFGYDPQNILYEENAGFAKFNELFGSEREYKGRLYKFVRNGVSKVFIYYAGHGAPDLESQEAYFVPVDANPEYLKSSGYSLQTFYTNLSKIPAKKMTVILDTCFSGNSEKGMLFKNISPAMVRVKKEYQGPANTTLITSGAVDQVSAWYPEKRHSLFTYYFLKGIQGEADVNKDKKITVGEMKVYLAEHVPYMAQRLKGTEQQPVVMGNDSDVMVVLKK